MKEKDELSPAWKAIIVNAFGFGLLVGLLITYCWLPLGSFAFGALNRIWRGLMASITFGLLAIDFILVVDWVTLKEWFEFDADMAKALIISVCIAGMVAVWIAG